MYAVLCRQHNMGLANGFIDGLFWPLLVQLEK